ncbi:hypothetical protein FRC09_011528, partial [Ceratobasidium sp. 395]
RNHMSEHPQRDHFSGATIPALPSVFAELKLTHATLATATKFYRASCVKLIAACATPMHQPSQHLAAKKVLATVDSELKSLASQEDTLKQIHVSLIAARK